MKRTPTIRGFPDSGQSLVYMALLLVALLGFAGLALDFGSALVVRRQMQNAADAAALAGAREVYLERTDTQVNERIAQYAVNNRADSFTATYYPGGEAVGGGAVAGNGVCVNTNGVWIPAFIRLFGIETLNVNAISCATSRTDQYAGYTIWAHTDRTVPKEKDSCTFVWEGNKGGITVVGNIRSNYNVTLKKNSDRLVMDGRLEYVNNYTCKLGNKDDPEGSCIEFNPPGENPYKVSATTEWPVSFNIADFRPPNGVYAQQAAAEDKFFYCPNLGKDNDDLSTHWCKEDKGEAEISPPVLADDPGQGLYYVEGKVKIGNDVIISDDEVAGLTGRYTIVAEKQIEYEKNARAQNITPFIRFGAADDDVNGLLMFSNRAKNDKCADAIKLKATNSTWTGLIYAPDGKIKVEKSKNSTFRGMIVANGVQLKDSENMTIIGPGGSAFSNVRDIRLVPPP